VSQGLFASLYETGYPFALIDTRERVEHVNGHWFCSTNIPLSVLTSHINRLVPEHDFPIFLLDWQDELSEASAKQLSELGYSNVTRCKTSQPEAFGDGFVKGEFVWSKAFGEVVAHTCDLLEITPAEYLADYKEAHLFDVRPTAEYSKFTIPDSQSLPNSLLLDNLEMLKASGAMALLHCAGRTRSIIGACTLKAAGYEGPYAIFKGGTQAWQLDGLEREFEANRLFAKESNDVKPVKNFLDKWDISHQQLDDAELAVFVIAHKKEHLFDVSDDAAKGQLLEYDIVKISGTNLIQQTDRSIARYHVPVILFDNGSGSRAAFAAYWLKMMGLEVTVVYLKKELATRAADGQSKIKTTSLESATEKSLLFAGRHHGNMQDSRDYLAWEEELPGQIDPIVHELWLELLGKTFNVK
jgi:rhodanese-related sulfurtransferase